MHDALCIKFTLIERVLWFYECMLPKNALILLHFTSLLTVHFSLIYLEFYRGHRHDVQSYNIK